MYYFRYLLNNDHNNGLCSFNKYQKIKLYYASHIALAPPFTKTNTFHASLTEEYPQRDVIMSELRTCVWTSDFIHLCKSAIILPYLKVNAGHVYSLYTIQTKTQTTKVIPIADLWADPHCNDNLWLFSWQIFYTQVCYTV